MYRPKTEVSWYCDWKPNLCPKKHFYSNFTIRYSDCGQGSHRNQSCIIAISYGISLSPPAKTLVKHRKSYSKKPRQHCPVSSRCQRFGSFHASEILSQEKEKSTREGSDGAPGPDSFRALMQMQRQEGQASTASQDHLHRKETRSSPAGLICVVRAL